MYLFVILVYTHGFLLYVLVYNPMLFILWPRLFQLFAIGSSFTWLLCCFDTLQHFFLLALLYFPFSSCLQSFPASESFPVSQFFTSGGQSIGASASASVLPIQDWFPLGWTGWISLLSKGLSRVFSNTTVQSINSSVLCFIYSPTLTSIHDYWKNHSFD